MKIAFFSDAYIPVPSGTAVSIETLRTALNRMGHKVYIFAPKFPDWKDNNKFVSRMPAKFYSGEYRPKSFPLKFYTPEQISKMNFDIVHAHYFFDAFPYPIKFAENANAPLVTTFHRHFPEFYRRKTGLSSAQTNFERYQSRLINFANHSNIVVATSNYSKKYLKNLGVASDIETIPIGTYSQDFISIPQNILKSKYKIDPADKIILLVCSIEKESNLESIIKNFKSIWKAVDGVHLLIVGGGDRLDFLQEATSRLAYGKKITFTGPMPKNVINKFYGACDILIQPSNLDPQPLCVLESLTAGTPVVTQENCAAAEFVTDNQDGFVASARSDDFYEKIATLLIKDSTRLSFSLKARINSQRFKAFNLAHNLLELYESEISQKQLKSNRIKWKS